MRAKLGDVIEIPTNVGLAYAQYTHKHPKYGSLLRVFEKFFHERPKNLEVIISGGIRFSTFFPLHAALSQRIFENIGNVPVSEELQIFPVFRAGVPNPKTKTVELWWLWDGEREWRIGELTPEQRTFPIRGIWNDTLMIERIESNWRPETDFR